jgi:membrane-bound lytic murein transglycosylase MltF
LIASVFQKSYLRVLILTAVALAAACSGKKEELPSSAPAAAATSQTATPAESAAAEDVLPPTASPYDVLPVAVRDELDKPFTGDLDDMVKRRTIRVAVTFNRTHYFIDRGAERGLTLEWARIFEEELNKDMKTTKLKTYVVMVPMSRDQLYPALVSGKVDMVAAMITVTPEREKLVAFSDPTRSNVNEVVVTGPGAPPIASVDDLAGQEVFVRKGSIYQESLVRLNTDLKARGKAPVIINEAPVVLEDDDILEMVNAGLVPITVVDEYLAEFWNNVFKNIKVHSKVAVQTGGTLAVAFRKENPKIREAVNKMLKKHGENDAVRRILEGKYLNNTRYARNATANAERKKFQAVVDLFKKYGEKYNLDYLLVAAQSYQESTLDHGARSPVGAIGIMQVMPATGKDMRVGDITRLEANIHAGAKYMRFMMDEFYKDEPMDNLNKALMTFASYNAGPNRLTRLRAETKKRGLDPNLWFGNVERITSERIGRETVTYVSNIYKYYIAYRLMTEQREQRDAAKTEARGTTK